MIQLFHYTSVFHAPLILEQGISRGEVPVSHTESTTGVSLTRDGIARRQAWCRTTRMICGGDVLPVDKTAVRLTVQIPDDDPRLLPWKEAACRLGVTTSYYRELDASGGGGDRDWYVYFGVIPPEWITRVETKERLGYELADPAVFPRIDIVFTSDSAVRGIHIRKFSTQEALRRMGI